MNTSERDSISEFQKAILNGRPERTTRSWWSVMYDARNQVFIAIENTQSGVKTRLTYKPPESIKNICLTDQERTSILAQSVVSSNGNELIPQDTAVA